MNRARTALLVLAFLAFVGVAAVWAGRSAHVNLFWQVLSGGGGPVASGSGRVALNGSLGQTAIDVSSSGGDSTVLRSGYWPGTTGTGWEVFLPIVLRAP
jgi:hypothetical protein